MRTALLLLLLLAAGCSTDLDLDNYGPIPNSGRVLGVGGALPPGGAYDLRSHDEAVARIEMLGFPTVIGVAPGTAGVDVIDQADDAVIDTVSIHVAALTEIRLDGMPDHLAPGETRDLRIVPLVGDERSGGYHYLAAKLDGTKPLGVVYDTLRLDAMSAGMHHLELRALHSDDVFTYAIEVR